MTDGYAPIEGKCMYWRELGVEDDKWDPSIPRADWRVRCSCFIEGNIWSYTTSTVPGDCPDRQHCRYYIRNA